MEVTNECKNQNCRSSYEKTCVCRYCHRTWYPACDLPWNPARQFPQTVRRQRSGGNHVRSGCLDVQVSVDEDHINEITMVHLDETVETMYPLVRPTLDELAKQIISSQSLTDLTYSKNNQYTCRLLIGAVSEALEKASPDR